MSSRKPHVKSRTGCLEYKRRHIKCDEQQPQCWNCRRLGKDCLPSQTTSASSRRTPPSKNLDVVQHFAYISTRLKDQSVVSEHLAIDDLKLLHHFSIATYATLDNVVAQRRLWQEDIIQIGFQYPFVLRGILAISSLHLASLDSNVGSVLLIKASTQHNYALSDFRAALTSVDDSNCTAIFAFACLTVIHAFAVARIQIAKDPVADIQNCMQLIRGVNSILQPHWTQLMATELSPLLNNEWRRGVFGEVPEILRLKVLIDSLPDLDNGTTRAAYVEAVEQLHTVFLEVTAATGERSDLALLFTWPIMLSEKFLLLLSARQPVALVILAHFTALFHTMGNCWWLAGWNEHIIDALDLALSADFQDWLTWPKQISKMPNVELRK